LNFHVLLRLGEPTPRRVLEPLSGSNVTVCRNYNKYIILAKLEAFTPLETPELGKEDGKRENFLTG